ncbi:hypothetical protein SEA_DALANDE_2 [Gordonia phage DalanDe]|nr:hypothetical protein SEA_DALANDE_2 [Gordonia phage DalanDe]
MTKPLRKRTRTPGTPTYNPTRKETIYDWTGIRRDYIEGVPIRGSQEREWLSLKELAERHDIPYGRVRKRSSSERWPEHKQAAEYTAMMERAKVRAKQIETNALDFDDKAFTIAKTGMALVHARMAELGQDMQAHRAIRAQALANKENGLPYKDKDLYSAVRHNEIDALASAAQKFQDIGQRALGTDVKKIDLSGELTSNTEVTINISDEVKRDDPERLADMLAAMNQAGVIPDDVLAAMSADDEVIDAEVEEDEQPAIEGGEQVADGKQG